MTMFFKSTWFIYLPKRLHTILILRHLLIKKVQDKCIIWQSFRICFYHSFSRYCLNEWMNEWMNEMFILISNLILLTSLFGFAYDLVQFTFELKLWKVNCNRTCFLKVLFTKSFSKERHEKQTKFPTKIKVR